jgi:tetrahedral aminopeptidase
MDKLLRELLEASGISGYEKEITSIMKRELAKCSDSVTVDAFGNCIARKGRGKKKIMIAAHMDEIGLLVKQVTKEGFLGFIKIGGIDDRVLVGQRVVIKSKGGDIPGIIGAKPPHLQREEERKQVIKYEDMFIDAGFKNKDEADKAVSIADPVIFEPNAGELRGGLSYGKAIDNRLGCYALIKVMAHLRLPAEIYGVATVQEEVGLKGARTSSFRINPDFALAIDTTCAGDSPGIRERESCIKVGGGVAITIIEAAGRGVIVNQKVKELFTHTAQTNKIKYQIDVVEGGMTDGAMIYMNREGIETGVLSIPARYVHSPSGVFSMEDVKGTIDLTVKVLERMVRNK